MAAVRPQKAVRRTLQWLALTVLLVLGVVELLGGTGGLLGPPRTSADVARATVEDLAQRIGCTADITADTTDLRQGLCTLGEDEVWIATFPTTGAQKAWTSEAEAYGGSYLVGDRWVLVVSDTTADLLHAKLGGVITGGADHTGHADHADRADHSDHGDHAEETGHDPSGAG
ncbi:hypothetical protein F7Q99_22050 [Streptomyces kaniharaensis]|uniref:Uncharacterized protein n=1 Tax=Streptomyces kaniharaensis TaxID=212423 RepID=A0A6N7KX79_9ACTN|nr:hypothetical protein [Streptomyces kaniharaensis]MQS14868.1 hypothetical protein [Streptomyces kaniharaensis]